jgi:radical SAM-linked protein
MKTLEKGSALKVRYAIKFSKESQIKFISHLDLMRTIQRIIRRAKLPVEYSKGFNPHMSLSLAQPLSVGIYSRGEYMDVVLDKEVSEVEIKEALSKSAPAGIKIFEVVKMPPQVLNEKKLPQSMALVEAASYNIAIKYNVIADLEANLKELLQKEEWNTLKKSKSGEKEVNIKALVKKFDYKISDNVLNLDVVIACGSRENLSPDLLSSYIKGNTEGANNDAFVDIERTELFTYVGEKLVSLVDYLRQISK